MYLKNDELLIIEVSLDNKNISLAEKLIKQCIKEMQDGKYSDELLEDAKRNLLFSLKVSSDNNVSVLGNYVFHVFDNLPLLEDRCESLKKVERDDLIKCGSSLSLNTIYVQKGSETSEGN